MSTSITVAVLTSAEGAHLDAYLTGLAQTEEAKTVVVADPSGKAEPLAKKLLGNKLSLVSRDPVELLRKATPQLALVTVPADQAPPIIDAALDAGCHVIAEKPSCLRVADFEPLVRKAQRTHRHLMLALANRTHAPAREARRLIQEGHLGRLYGIEVHFIADQSRLRAPDYPKRWYGQKSRAGGGSLIWLGIHWLDLVLFITGRQIRQVAGFAGVVGGQPIDVEDSAALALRFDGNLFGTMTSGYYLDRGYQSHIQIWGEEGWLRLASVEELPLEWYSRRDRTKPATVQRFDYPKGGRSYTPFVRAAVRAAAGLEPAPLTGEEGLHVLRAIFAFYDAVRTGRAQEVG